MSTKQPNGAELLELKRQAFLLDQLDSARTAQLTRADANKRIPKQIQEELAMAPSVANDLRNALTSQGLVSEQKLKRRVLYSITGAGRVWLQENQFYIPLKPANGKTNGTTDDSTHRKRIAHILLQLVDASEGGQSATELNNKLGVQRTKLKLNAATARHVRGRLIDSHFIAVIRTARSEKYTLTAVGYAYLVTLSFDELDKLTLSGPALTRLLRAARTNQAGSTITLPEPTPALKTAPTTSQLGTAVVQVLQELRRKMNTKIVPIHEVRSAVQNQFGAASAAHDVFDEIVFELRRAKKLRMISISDPSRATAEQLRDSIAGVGETFFFLENVDESPSN